MRDGLREIVDRELSGLRWQPRNRSAVLARTKGEPKMKKRMSAGLILAVALTLAAVSALAVYALTRSPEAEAKYQARQAVMDAYGLTAETMGLFHAEHEETDDGWRVTFRALANIDPGRAGVYTVEKTADGRTAAWSHDGLDPALWRGGDLTAPAYGQEQLLYALNEGQEEALALARESAASGPMQTPPVPAPVNEDASVWMDVREVEPGPEDMSLAEAKEIMRAAAQEELGLSGAGRPPWARRRILTRWARGWWRTMRAGACGSLRWRWIWAIRISAAARSWTPAPGKSCCLIMNRAETAEYAKRRGASHGPFFFWPRGPFTPRRAGRPRRPR